MEGSFFYFAYGTYVNPDVLTTSLAGFAQEAACTPAVLSSRAALLPGYRLNCDAVSAEGPRLGRLNLMPDSLVPRDPSSPTMQHAAQNTLSDDFLSAFHSGVRGVVHELPAALRAPLLQAVAQEGSFNVYATLPCYLVGNGQGDKGVATAGDACEATVIAALDFPLMMRRYVLDEAAAQQWQELPLPRGVSVPTGLSSVALSSAATPSSATTAAGASRWPGLHWCNCVSSPRVAPSTAYAEAIRSAYATHLLPSTGAANASYERAIHTIVYAPARDVDHEPQEAKTWYLAYGSNLSWEQVCLRIGPPYQRRAVQLDGYVLVPNKTPLDRVKYASFGYYNVEPVATREAKSAAGAVPRASTMPSHVCGAAYCISLAQLELMDSYESGYRRELLPCTDLCDPAATPMDCWTYIALETSEELLPSREYLSRVLEGSDILPLAYMEAIRNTPANPLRSPRQDQRLRKEI